MIDNSDKYFSLALKEILKEKKITQKFLSDCIKIEQPTISRIVGGKSPGKIENLKKIATFFNKTYYEMQARGHEISTGFKKTNHSSVATIQDHQNVIKKFIDQKKALHLNEMLVELESLDPETYEYIYSKTSCELIEIKRKNRAKEKHKTNGSNSQAV